MADPEAAPSCLTPGQLNRFISLFPNLLFCKMEDAITAFLHGVVDKLPHRPTSDDECRSLFKRIVSSMPKGDVRKHIIKDLEGYFGVFEEYLVEKESALVEELVGGKGKDKRVLVKQDQFIRDIQMKATCVKNLGNWVSDKDFFDNILSGSVSVDECVMRLCADSFGAIKSGRQICDSSKLLLENSFGRVVIELSCTHSPNIPLIACVFSYFYLVLPRKREKICKLLMTQGVQDSNCSITESLRSVALVIHFLGFLGYWVSVSVLGACDDTVGWSIDDNTKGKDRREWLESDMDCQHLVMLFKDIVYHYMNKHSVTLTQLQINSVERGVVPSGSVSLVTHIALFTAFAVQRHAGQGASECRRDKELHSLLVNVMMSENKKGGSVMGESIVWTSIKTDILKSNDSALVELDQTVATADSKFIVELVRAIWTDESVMQKIVMMLRESVVCIKTESNKTSSVFDGVLYALANEGGDAAVSVDAESLVEEKRQPNSGIIDSVCDKKSSTVVENSEEQDDITSVQIAYEFDTMPRQSTRSSSAHSTSNNAGTDNASRTPGKKSKIGGTVLESYKESVELDGGENVSKADLDASTTPKRRSERSRSTPSKRTKR